ncbi:MAG: hypothetical protein IIC73_00085 [Armatimonadetes bacterium]|nr:hypothetical protein [Armatimonadota bacterium]
MDKASRFGRGAVLAGLAFGASLTMFACGGGGGTTSTTGGSTTTGGSSTGGPPPVTTGGGTTTGGSTTSSGITVSVAPAIADVLTDDSIQYSATVSGSSNTAVTWSVEGGQPLGTISSTGLYTAPSIAGFRTIKAASQEDPLAFGTAGANVKQRATIELIGAVDGFNGLPTIMSVNGISDDGTTVVGQSGSAGSTAPAYWTKSFGWVNLPLPTGTTDGNVFAVSTDGQWLAGSAKLSGGNFVPARWSPAGGAELAPAPTGVNASDPGAAVAISADGLIIVGNWNSMPFRWHQALGSSVLSDMTEALALSFGGSTVGGVAEFMHGGLVLRGTLWTDAGGATEVGFDQTSRVQSVSADGQVISGTDRNGAQFLWSSALKFPYQTFAGSIYRDLSRDGTVLVGKDAGGTFLWTAIDGEDSTSATGKKSLVQTLGDAGFTGDLSKWDFDGAVYVSGDGKRLAGGVHDKASGKLMFFYATLP